MLNVKDMREFLPSWRSRKRRKISSRASKITVVIEKIKKRYVVMRIYTADRETISAETIAEVWGKEINYPRGQWAAPSRGS